MDGRTIAGIILVLTVIFTVWCIYKFISNAIYRANPQNAPLKFCQNCGSTARVWKKNRGSFGLEVVLWLFFLLPGILYSLWRLSGKVSTCPKCGSEDMVLISSPKAQAAINLSERVKCSFCAELIKPDAKVCRFCGNKILNKTCA